MHDSINRRLLLEGVEKRPGSSAESIIIRIPWFELRKGEIVAIVGDNGSGKSTLLNIIAMLQQPDKVDRFLLYTEDGKEINVLGLGSRQISFIRRNLLAYILQGGGLLEFLTIKQNIALVQRLKGGKLANPDEITRALGIDDVLGKKPGQLSGGQRQKGAIARALIQQPDIILADEPTSAMDLRSARRLMDIFTQRTKSSETSLALVSHDLNLVKNYADRVYRFHLGGGDNGRIVSTLRSE